MHESEGGPPGLVINHGDTLYMAACSPCSNGMARQLLAFHMPQLVPFRGFWRTFGSLCGTARRGARTQRQADIEMYTPAGLEAQLEGC